MNDFERLKLEIEEEKRRIYDERFGDLPSLKEEDALLKEFDFN